MPRAASTLGSDISGAARPHPTDPLLVINDFIGADDPYEVLKETLKAEGNEGA